VHRRPSAPEREGRPATWRVARRPGGGVKLVADGRRPPRPYVRILRAAVCGTDLQIARGDRDDVATTLGHEGVGLLHDGGPPRLVAFNPVQRDEQDVILGHSYDGIFRSYFAIDGHAPTPELIDVAEDVALDVAALCEPVAAAMYGWEIAGARPLETVGVWGAGPMGLTHALLALDRGLRLVLVHPRRSRLEWAKRTLFEGPGSAVDFRTPNESPLPRLDAAFLCTDRAGAAGALAEAVGALRPDGLAVLVGGFGREAAHPDVPGVDLGVVRRRNVCGSPRPPVTVSSTTSAGKPVLLAGHRGTHPRHFELAQRLLVRRRTFFEALITHAVEPSEAVDLVNRRCAGESHDGRGREIVKIVMRF
jgi:2-epi-valiolone-7-phosphate 1-reductase